MDKQRTLKQNKALYKMMSELSNVLNETGYDMRKVIKEGIDIPWSPESVKTCMWLPVMKAFKSKDSTTELTTKDIDDIFSVIVRVIGERTGITLNWPSIELLMDNKEIVEK